MPDRPPAVPDRICGDCTWCCQYLPIDTPEIQLMPGTLCACNDGKSCTIYETRPQVCRDYLCGWRLFASFDEDWRPDQFGAMATVVNANIPDNYLQEGIEWLLVRPAEVLAREDFLGFIFKSMAAKLPMFFSLTAPPGFFPNRLFLNARLEKSARTNDWNGFIAALQTAVDDLKETPFAPATFRHGKPA